MTWEKWTAVGFVFWIAICVGYLNWRLHKRAEEKPTQRTQSTASHVRRRAF